MGRATRFKGPVMTGTPDTGVSATSTLDTLPAVRRISVSADGVYVMRPFPPCDFVRLWVNTETAWEGSAGTSTTLRFGTSADNDLFGSVVLSGVATRDLVVSGASLLGLASGQQVIVDVTTAGTAGVGTASFYVQYLQAQG